jgi:hypothetical protein
MIIQTCAISWSHRRIKNKNFFKPVLSIQVSKPRMLELGVTLQLLRICSLPGDAPNSTVPIRIRGRFVDGNVRVEWKAEDCNRFK